jgi:hypothetical protein
MIDDECEGVDGMVVRRNQNTQRKPTTVPLFPPQIPHGLTRARTQVAEAGNRRLTAWTMARPSYICIMIISCVHDPDNKPETRSAHHWLIRLNYIGNCKTCGKGVLVVKFFVFLCNFCPKYFSLLWIFSKWPPRCALKRTWVFVVQFWSKFERINKL